MGGGDNVCKVIFEKSGARGADVEKESTSTWVETVE